jgi:hypothetical protein
VRGPEGNVYAHPESGGTYHGAGGETAVHGEEGTAVRGPEGNVYAHPESGGAYHGATGSAYYAHGAAGYGAHAALPTDAGYGMSAARAGTSAYAGYHHTAAISGSVAAARGASVRSAYGNPGLYGRGWRAANPGIWAPAGWAAGHVWHPCNWAAVGGWLDWGGIQPVYYDYGTNIVYQDDQVYYGDQPVATAADYYQQASTLAQSVPPPPDPQGDDWTPLGVFALVQNDQSEPSYIIQLAVNKVGVLGGNYTDLVSGTTLPVHGCVDKRSQRVAWTVGSNKATVGETGMYNLTQDESPALIHIGKDKTQQWLLVRLKQPEDQPPSQ